jgi:hypothetical protein
MQTVRVQRQSRPYSVGCEYDSHQHGLEICAECCGSGSVLKYDNAVLNHLH